MIFDGIRQYIPNKFRPTIFQEPFIGLIEVNKMNTWFFVYWPQIENVMEHLVRD